MTNTPTTNNHRSKTGPLSTLQNLTIGYTKTTSEKKEATFRPSKSILMTKSDPGTTETLRPGHIESIRQGRGLLLIKRAQWLNFGPNAKVQEIAIFGEKDGITLHTNFRCHPVRASGPPISRKKRRNRKVTEKPNRSFIPPPRRQPNSRKPKKKSRK